jgi:chromatin remodeling complex protein RSC6
MATAKKTEDAKKVVKATPADLVAKVEASKKAAAKVEAPKATAAKVEAPKAEEKKAAAPKKTAVKAEAPKAEEKKAAPAKKAPAKKAAVKTSETVFIEFAGGQIEIASIVEKVKESLAGKAVKDLKVYYQPEKSVAYYTADGESGSVNL